MGYRIKEVYCLPSVLRMTLEIGLSYKNDIDNGIVIRIIEDMHERNICFGDTNQGMHHVRAEFVCTLVCVADSNVKYELLV